MENFFIDTTTSRNNNEIHIINLIFKHKYLPNEIYTSIYINDIWNIILINWRIKWRKIGEHPGRVLLRGIFYSKFIQRTRRAKRIFIPNILIKIAVNCYMTLEGFADVPEFFQDEREDKVRRRTQGGTWSLT